MVTVCILWLLYTQVIMTFTVCVFCMVYIFTVSCIESAFKSDHDHESLLYNNMPLKKTTSYMVVKTLWHAVKII